MAAPTITRSGLKDLRDRQVERLRRASQTSPGRLGLLGVGLLLLISVAGLFAATGVAQRARAMDSLVNQSEPMSAAAQELYRALSDADATASRAYLHGGLEPPDVRARYETDIAQAESALARAARGATDEAAVLINELATQLPVYTALVETARANNRQGFPVGAGYLREANGLMQEKLLRAASELYDIEAAKQNADHEAADDFPLIELLLGLIVLAGLVAAQRYLTQRTNRLLNIGLLVGAGATAVWLLWSMVALIGQADDLNDSKREGSAQVAVLVRARIGTLDARSNETLTLVARGDGRTYEERYVQRSDELGGLLREAGALTTDSRVRAEVDEATRHAQAWREAHTEVRRLDDSGDYRKAVDMAILATPESTATAVSELEADLADAIRLTREAFSAEAADARRSLAGLVAGIVVLTLVAAVGTGIGVWQRFREYW